MAVLAFVRRSGRVISLARAMLSSLFLLAVWVDPTQPALNAEFTYSLMAAYAVFALGIALVTWNSWWLDARLAGPAHFLDLGYFTALVFLTDGYTSPFFIYFVFILLSAAIRWDWRETAVTSVALIILYLGTGLGSSLVHGEEFELQRFIVRTGHLLVLSMLLIWFGIYDRRLGDERPVEDQDPSALGDPPLVSALASAIATTGARRGVLVWQDLQHDRPIAIENRDGELRMLGPCDWPLRSRGDMPSFIYDIARDRGLVDRQGYFPATPGASSLIDSKAATGLRLDSGLVVPVRLESGSGAMFLEGLSNLAADHLQIGEDLAREMALQMQRHALIQAVEESSESRARLTLARDLHDSVVQFLAGLAFRIEAMIRKSRSGTAMDSELELLKRLVLAEQSDLRTYIVALRTTHEIAWSDMVAELRTLSAKVAEQWAVECDFQAKATQRMVPARLHLDAQQLIREAAANAVRHGKATALNIFVDCDDQSLCLKVEDDGCGFPTESGSSGTLRPRSLSERVADAGGELELASSDAGTSVIITLPMKGSGF